MADLKLIYTTWPDSEAAQGIASAMLERRLIACANIFSAGKSVYRWKGEIRSEDEIVMILKTARQTIEAATAYLERHHPYDTACIIVLENDAAHTSSAFANWVNAEVIGPA
jgi:periplasmic divalent cation tolerance protein